MKSYKQFLESNGMEKCEEARKEYLKYLYLHGKVTCVEGKYYDIKTGKQVK